MIGEFIEFMARYGWFVTFGSIGLYVFYHKYVQTALNQRQANRELEERKKFDRDVSSREESRIRAARERQQESHAAVAAEQAARDKEREEARLRALADKTNNRGELSAQKLGGGDGRKEKEEGGVPGMVCKDGVCTVPGLGASDKPSSSAGSSSAADLVRRAVNSRPVVVFSKNSCPYCRKVKAALAIYRLQPSQFAFVEIDQMPNCSDVQDELERIAGSRTVPKVFIGGECVGGCDDTVALQRDGTLDMMIQSAIEAFQRRGGSGGGSTSSGGDADDDLNRYTSQQASSNARMPSDAHELFKGRSLCKKNGTRVDGGVELGGKVVALYFSAHWCPPCRMFTPLLKDFHADLADSGDFEVVFVSSDRSAAELRAYVAEAHGDWLYLEHGDPFIQQLKEKYGIQGIPCLIVIKNNGDVITKDGRSVVQSTAPSTALSNWKRSL